MLLLSGRGLFLQGQLLAQDVVEVAGEQRLAHVQAAARFQHAVANLGHLQLGIDFDFHVNSTAQRLRHDGFEFEGLVLGNGFRHAGDGAGGAAMAGGAFGEGLGDEASFVALYVVEDPLPDVSVEVADALAVAERDGGLCRQLGSVAFAEARVTDEAGRLVATAQGSWRIIRKAAT